MSGQVLAENAKGTPLPGKPALVAGAYDLAALGYDVQEFTVAGSARAFAAAAPLADDGAWKVKPAGSADYKTRVVVIKPTDPAKFNGTVLVEWLNVTGGLDVPVEWITSHRELVRRGYAYVAVSAQKVGIDDGPSRARGTANPLKKADPVRYAGLVHPGDAYSFDMFSDVGRLLRAKDGVLLGGLRPRRLLAVGESQSAFFLATYVNAIDPVAKVYDGYLIHSRAGGTAPLTGEAMFTMTPEQLARAVKMRPDLRVPVIQLITETDLIQLGTLKGFYAARQPDAGHLRTWELAGSAHADNYIFGVGMIDAPGVPVERLAAAWAPTASMMGTRLPVAMNNGPQVHYVAQAAISGLDAWVGGGRPPEHAAEIELGSRAPVTLAVDANGNALGGLRTPWVDAPISRLAGDPRGASSDLTGVTEPFDAAKLKALYPGGSADYLGKFTASLDRTIAKGFILPEDRQEILRLAEIGFAKGMEAR